MNRLRSPAFRLGALVVAAAGVVVLASGVLTANPTTDPAPAIAATAPPPTIEATSAPAAFEATIRTIGPETIARMGTSWRPGCPVSLEDLRSIVMPFWGFDGAIHTGELIVHRRQASKVAGVFRTLFDARFPIERMDPANGYMGNDPPLAQRNNTAGFNCRKPVGGGRAWSEHSYGSAIDINPDQNPYVSRGGRVEPLYGRAFVDRALDAPGMITADSLVVRSFRTIGWRWGGSWRGGTKDYMHFSASGR